MEFIAHFYLGFFLPMLPSSSHAIPFFVSYLFRLLFSFSFLSLFSYFSRSFCLFLNVFISLSLPFPRFCVQDDAEAQRQIQQMVKFILNEARDKAQEIEARSLEDFNIEKLKLVQQMKDKIRQEYDKKAKKTRNTKSYVRHHLSIYL